MALNIEDTGGLTVVKYNGLNTNKTITVGGSANFDMSGSSGTFKFPKGTVQGLTPATVSGSGATVTLTAAQSGSTILFDRAAGIVYTLPVPVVGLQYTFIVTTTITSNNAKVITDAGTTLVQGSVQEATTGAAPNTYFGNGTTHIAIVMNGTTTGGILGSEVVFTCVSATLWQVSGSVNASGTIATPFSTT